MCSIRPTQRLVQKSGQSLVEVVVAVGLISIVLIGLVSALTFSMANVQFSRNRAQATKYAQEAIEWFRIQRDAMDWNTFKSNLILDGADHCMTTLTWPSGNPPCSAISDTYNIFRREVTVDDPLSDRVTIHVEVNWAQGVRTSKVELDTYLTEW